MSEGTKRKYKILEENKVKDVPRKEQVKKDGTIYLGKVSVCVLAQALKTQIQLLLPYTLCIQTNFQRYQEVVWGVLNEERLFNVRGTQDGTLHVIIQLE